MNFVDSAFYAESWNVAFRMKQEGEILKDRDSKFKIIPNSLRYWAADPMVIEIERKIYIFAELYDYIRSRGVLGYTVYNGKKFTKWKPVIVEKHHLSYPFVILHNRKVYIIPESGADLSLNLYEAIDFPNKWKRVKTIKSGVNWADSTFYKIDTGFRGYTEVLDEKPKLLQLELDYNFNILNEQPDALKHDPNTGRCGGRVFFTEKFFVRVCQDCIDDYGKGLFFYCFNKETGQEQNVVHILPYHLNFDKNIPLRGMHTYTATTTMEVIDIKTRRLNVINLIFRLVNKFRHIKRY